MTPSPSSFLLLLISPLPLLLQFLPSPYHTLNITIISTNNNVDSLIFLFLLFSLHRPPLLFFSSALVSYRSSLFDLVPFRRPHPYPLFSPLFITFSISPHMIMPPSTCPHSRSSILFSLSPLFHQDLLFDLTPLLILYMDSITGWFRFISSHFAPLLRLVINLCAIWFCLERS